MKQYDIGGGRHGYRMDADGSHVWVEHYGDLASITWSSRSNITADRVAKIGSKLFDISDSDVVFDVYTTEEKPARYSDRSIHRLEELLSHHAEDVEVVRIRADSKLTLVWQRSLDDPTEVEVSLAGTIDSASHLAELLADTGSDIIGEQCHALATEVDHLLRESS